MRILPAGAIAGVLFLFSVEAHAQAAVADRDIEQAQVSTRGVDFRDPRSVDQFYKRLRRAVREVCDSRLVGDRVTAEADRTCARDALNRTVASLSRPMLTARAERSGAEFASGWN